MLCDFMGNLACKHPFKINNPNIIQRMLMITPFRMNWGLRIFKNVFIFNPKNPRTTKILTWVILCRLPIKFNVVGWEIVVNLGSLLTYNKGSTQALM